MFSAASVRLGRRGGPARRLHGLHHFTSTLATSSKKPYRKGVVFTTISGLVITSGIIFTVLGFTDVLGAGVTMMGMLMTAMSILLFMAAIRMFLISAKLRKAERTLQISRGTVASMVIEREDERGTLTVVMDTVNIETRCRRRSNDSSRPPDYHEATSDYYPESTSEIVMDSIGVDPPPPYGPPTYDQAMSESKHDRLDSQCKGNLGVDDDSNNLCSDLNPGTSHGNNLCSDRNSGTSHEYSEDNSGEPGGDVNREPAEVLHEYQDLPAVTI